MKQLRFNLLMAAMAVIGIMSYARAADKPVRETTVITNTVKASLGMPAFQGVGQLVAIQIVDDGQTTNTVTVTHRVPVSTTRTVTNSVATLSYTTTHGASLTVTNGPYYAAGDWFDYAFSTSSTGLVIQTRTIVQ